MSLRLYCDEHVPSAVVSGLRQRQVDVLTAQEDGATGRSDETLLRRATELGRVVFTRDRDFLVLARRWSEAGVSFTGVIFAHQARATIGQLIEDLSLMAQVLDPDELHGQVRYLPL